MFVWAAFFFDNKVRTPCQLVFQDGEYEAAAREVGLGCEVEWFPGGWMSRQRFAGRLGGKAEFVCGLTEVSTATFLQYYMAVMLC